VELPSEELELAGLAAERLELVLPNPALGGLTILLSDGMLLEFGGNFDRVLASLDALLASQYQLQHLPLEGIDGRIHSVGCSLLVNSICHPT
jgi:hypothetical protein